MMEVIDVLSVERGYKIEFFPAQKAIPLRDGNVDDRFCMYHFLSKQAPVRRRGKGPGGGIVDVERVDVDYRITHDDDDDDDMDDMDDMDDGGGGGDME